MRNHFQTKFIVVNTGLCKACWTCVKACPNGVLAEMDFFVHKHVYVSHPENCIGCGKCAKVCPRQAIIKRMGD